MQKQGDTMAEVTYRPAHVKGEVRIPPSKSAAHRALLSAALCKTPCRVGPIDHSADMEATLNGVCAMGGTVKAPPKYRKVKKKPPWYLSSILPKSRKECASSI